MKKPWYTYSHDTLDGFMKGHNLVIIHQMFWFLSKDLGLNFPANGVLDSKAILHNEVIDWYTENGEK